MRSAAILQDRRRDERRRKHLSPVRQARAFAPDNPKTHTRTRTLRLGPSYTFETIAKFIYDTRIMITRRRCLFIAARVSHVSRVNVERFDGNLSLCHEVIGMPERIIERERDASTILI